jgi:uncharacterized protein (TIGR02569 family)
VNPEAAAAAFGLSGPCEPIPGGAGTSVRCGDVVLKPGHESYEARFVQETMAGLDGDSVGIRIPPVHRASDGRVVIDGWTATRFIPGLRELRPHWVEIADAGERFHELLASLHPDAARTALERRTHRWAIADRVAWDEAIVTLAPRAQRVDAALSDWCHPTDESQQVVHADLTGNVLVDDDDTPVIIDFSPYVRPRSFATAVVVADALIWEGASLDVIDLLGPEPRPMLARALRFRLVAEQLADAARHGADIQPYEALITQLA